MGEGSVLMAVSTYRGFGGHEMVINNLCNGLNKMGYDTAVGAFSFQHDPPPNIRKINLRQFQSLVSTNDFDIIHSHQTSINYYSFLTPKPFVFHWHGASNRIQELNLKLAMLLCKRRINKIISISHSALDHLCSIAGDDISSLSEIIYNGVDTSYYHTNLSHPYTKGDPQLLFVGNLYPHKNVTTIIDAMTKIIEQYPSAHLQIVGDGADRANLSYEIKRKQLEKHVELVGQLPPEELKLRYSSCDIYISASKWEMFGLPPLEAMACGKPVILSDIPSHGELVAGSNAGAKFSLSDSPSIIDKVQDVYSNKSVLGIAARKFAEANDWSVVCSKIADIYTGIKQI